MYKRCATPETAERQKQLEEHLLKSMLEKPYCDISVSDLCEQAGISRKSFYRYFGNKDGCLNSLLDRILLGSSDYSATANYSAGQDSPELLQIMSYWMDQKPLLDAITANNLQSRLLDRCIQHTIHEARETLRWLGVTDVSQDSESIIFSVTGFLAVLLEWSRTNFPRTPSEMAQIMTKIWTQPLMTSPEGRQ